MKAAEFGSAGFEQRNKPLQKLRFEPTENTGHNTNSPSPAFVSIHSKRKFSDELFKEIKPTDTFEADVVGGNKAFYLPKSLGQMIGLPKRYRKAGIVAHQADWSSPKVYDLGEGVNYTVANPKPPVVIKDFGKARSSTGSASTSVAGYHAHQNSLASTDQEFASNLRFFMPKQKPRDPLTSSREVPFSDEAIDLRSSRLIEDAGRRQSEAIDRSQSESQVKGDSYRTLAKYSNLKNLINNKIAMGHRIPPGRSSRVQDVSKLAQHLYGLNFTKQSSQNLLDLKAAQQERSNYDQLAAIKRNRLQQLDETNRFIEEKLVSMAQSTTNRHVILRSQLSMSQVKSMGGVLAGSSAPRTTKSIKRLQPEQSLSAISPKLDISSQSQVPQQLDKAWQPPNKPNLILIRERDKVHEVDLDRRNIGPIVWDVYHKTKKIYAYLGCDFNRLRTLLLQYIGKSNLLWAVLMSSLLPGQMVLQEFSTQLQLMSVLVLKSYRQHKNDGLLRSLFAHKPVLDMVAAHSLNLWTPVLGERLMQNIRVMLDQSNRSLLSVRELRLRVQQDQQKSQKGLQKLSSIKLQEGPHDVSILTNKVPRSISNLVSVNKFTFKSSLSPLEVGRKSSTSSSSVSHVQLGHHQAGRTLGKPTKADPSETISHSQRTHDRELVSPILPRQGTRVFSPARRGGLLLNPSSAESSALTFSQLLTETESKEIYEFVEGVRKAQLDIDVEKRDKLFENLKTAERRVEQTKRDIPEKLALGRIYSFKAMHYGPVRKQKRSNHKKAASLGGNTSAHVEEYESENGEEMGGMSTNKLGLTYQQAKELGFHDVVDEFKKIAAYEDVMGADANHERLRVKARFARYTVHADYDAYTDLLFACGVSPGYS